MIDYAQRAAKDSDATPLRLHLPKTAILAISPLDEKDNPDSGEPNARGHNGERRG